MKKTLIIDDVRVVNMAELCRRIGIQASSSMLKELGVAKPFLETNCGIYWREDDVFPLAVALSKSIREHAGRLELERIGALHNMHKWPAHKVRTPANPE